MENHIVLAAEKLGSIGLLPITNTLIFSWIVLLVIAAFGILAGRNAKLIPAPLQNLAEFVIEYIYNLCEEVAHNEKKVKTFFPWVATFFFFILVANWLGLFPGVGGTVFIEDSGHKIPLLRSINSDLNMTLGLALLSAVMTHAYAIRFLGIKEYLLKWFPLSPMIFIGLLELVSEVTKVVSLSLRLFGNIFAGEVVLATISGIFAFVVPLPFYFLEIIVGIVQAAVFMMLTLVFMTILSEKHTGGEH